VQEVSDVAGISKNSCHEILPANFSIHRLAAKLVPGLLTYEQKLKSVKDI
jgi:hypothetical protein